MIPMKSACNAASANPSNIPLPTKSMPTSSQQNPTAKTIPNHRGCNVAGLSIRTSDRYSIDGWQLPSGSESIASLGYASDSGAKYQVFGASDKYAVMQGRSKSASTTRSLISYLGSTDKSSSSGSSQSDGNPYAYESFLASDGISIEVSSSGRLSSVSSSSTEFSLKTKNTNQSTHDSSSEDATSTTVHTTNPEKCRYALLQYSASSPLSSNMSFATNDKQEAMMKGKRVRERSNSWHSLEQGNDSPDWDGFGHCGDALAELQWLFQDNSNEMDMYIPSPLSQCNASADTNEEAGDLYARIHYIPHHYSLHSVESQNTCTSVLQYDGEDIDMSSSGTHSSSSEDLHEDCFMAVEGTRFMQEQETEARENAPNEIVDEILPSPRIHGGVGAKSNDELLPTQFHCDDDSLVEDSMVTIELSMDASKDPSPPREALPQVQNQCKQKDALVTQPEAHSFVTEVEQSVFHALDLTFILSLCNRKVKERKSPAPEEPFLLDLSKQPRRFANSRIITYLYSAIHSKNISDASRRLREHPEEARIWVACCDTISIEEGILKPVTVHFLPLHAACECDSPADFVKELIQKYPGAVRRRAGDLRYPIHIACESGASVEVIQILIDEWPGSIYALDGQNNMPIANLIRSKPLSPRQSEIMKLLLSSFSNIRKLS